MTKIEKKELDKEEFTTRKGSKSSNAYGSSLQEAAETYAEDAEPKAQDISDIASKIPNQENTQYEDRK